MRWCNNIWPRINGEASGYTLVELISVLAILGILFAMAWPAYRDMADKMALEQDAAVMVREIRLARQSAITAGRECLIIFVASSSSVPSISYEVRQNQITRTVRLSQGVRLVGTTFGPDPKYPSIAGRTACRIFPSGIPAQGGTVHLINNQDKSYYVAVTPVTARVRATETDPSN